MKIRAKTGLQSDGTKLVDQAFTLEDGMPPLAVNRVETSSGRSAHSGYAHFARGVVSAFRNPAAHDVKVESRSPGKMRSTCSRRSPWSIAASTRPTPRLPRRPTRRRERLPPDRALLAHAMPLPARQSREISTSSEYRALVNDVAAKASAARDRAARAVNTELVLLYWDIGQTILAEQQRLSWGDDVVGLLAQDLRSRANLGRGFSRRNLFYMRRFAALWPEERKVPPLAAQIGWTLHRVLLDAFGDGGNSGCELRSASMKTGSMAWNARCNSRCSRGATVATLGEYPQYLRAYARSPGDERPSTSSLERSSSA